MLSRSGAPMQLDGSLPRGAHGWETMEVVCGVPQTSKMCAFVGTSRSPTLQLPRRLQTRVIAAAFALLFWRSGSARTGSRLLADRDRGRKAAEYRPAAASAPSFFAARACKRVVGAVSHLFSAGRFSSGVISRVPDATARQPFFVARDVGATWGGAHDVSF